MSLCPPQIPHGLGQDWTGVSALTGRRLINWVQKFKKIWKYFSHLCAPRSKQNVFFESSQALPACSTPEGRRSVWGTGGETLTGKTDVLCEIPVPVPPSPLLHCQELNGDWTRDSTVRGRRLSASAIARPRTGPEVHLHNTQELSSYFRGHTPWVLPTPAGYCCRGKWPFVIARFTRNTNTAWPAFRVSNY